LVWFIFYIGWYYPIHHIIVYKLSVKDFSHITPAFKNIWWNETGCFSCEEHTCLQHLQDKPSGTELLNFLDKCGRMMMCGLASLHMWHNFLRCWKITSILHMLGFLLKVYSSFVRDNYKLHAVSLNQKAFQPLI